MRRSQRTGNRYLAGLVIIFSLFYLIIAAAEPGMLTPFFFAPLPGVAALFLGWRAWSTAGGKSVAYSTAGLVILLGALALARLRGNW
jgi:hypothetical protein